MRKFVASMSYDLGADTPPDARKLLRAELVGRRWRDRCRHDAMPHNTLWIERGAASDDTTDDVHTACATDLRDAIEAVRKTGRAETLVRCWIQVSGAGTFGTVSV